MAQADRKESPAVDIQPIYGSAIKVLTWGFRAGAALLLLGLAISLIQREPLNERVDPFGEIFPTLFDGDVAAVIDLAILTIMATPFATVLVVSRGFFRAGDRRFGTLSLIVLGILGVSVALSLLR